nr:MAG TPA: hypothetical protein [Caudoviricetes sp.]
MYTIQPPKTASYLCCIYRGNDLIFQAFRVIYTVPQGRKPAENKGFSRRHTP